MRTLIYLLVMVAVATGLLLFEDVGQGLPIVAMVVWAAVALAGLLVMLRARGRTLRRQRVPRVRRSRSRSAGLIGTRAKPALPQR